MREPGRVRQLTRGGPLCSVGGWELEWSNKSAPRDLHASSRRFVYTPSLPTLRNRPRCQALTESGKSRS